MVQSAGEATTSSWFVFPADAGAETDQIDNTDPVDGTDPVNDDAPARPPAPTMGNPATQAVKATTSQSVTNLPNTGTGTAAGTLNDEGTTLLLIALGTAILAGLAGTRKLAERRGA